MEKPINQFFRHEVQNIRIITQKSNFTIYKQSAKILTRNYTMFT